MGFGYLGTVAARFPRNGTSLFLFVARIPTYTRWPPFSPFLDCDDVLIQLIYFNYRISSFHPMLVDRLGTAASLLAFTRKISGCNIPIKTSIRYRKEGCPLAGSLGKTKFRFPSFTRRVIQKIDAKVAAMDP